MTITAGYVPTFTQGDGIRKAIETSSYTVQALADELDVDRNTVGRWIHGRTKPSKAQLMAVAQLTGVSLGWLLQLDSNQQPFGYWFGYSVVGEAERLLVDAVAR